MTSPADHPAFKDMPATQEILRHVEIRDREFPTFTVTHVEAPAMQFNRFLHDDGRYHTSVSFHDVTGLRTEETTVTTDDGDFPTTTLSFKVKGENVNITLFGVKA